MLSTHIINNSPYWLQILPPRYSNQLSQSGEREAQEEVAKRLRSVGSGERLPQLAEVFLPPFLLPLCKETLPFNTAFPEAEFFFVESRGACFPPSCFAEISGFL